MTGLDLLMYSERLRQEISRREERIRTIRCLTDALSHSLPGDLRVMTSPDPGRIQCLVDEAVDEEEAVRSLKEEQQTALAELALLFSRMPDALSASILRLRYLEGLSWHEILRRVHLSRSRVFGLHRKSLDLLDSWEVKQLQ